MEANVAAPGRQCAHCYPTGRHANKIKIVLQCFIISLTVFGRQGGYASSRLDHKLKRLQYLNRGGCVSSQLIGEFSDSETSMLLSLMVAHVLSANVCNLALSV